MTARIANWNGYRAGEIERSLPVITFGPNDLQFLIEIKRKIISSSYRHSFIGNVL